MSNPKHRAVIPHHNLFSPQAQGLVYPQHKGPSILNTIQHTELSNTSTKGRLFTALAEMAIYSSPPALRTNYLHQKYRLSTPIYMTAVSTPHTQQISTRQTGQMSTPTGMTTIYLWSCHPALSNPRVEENMQRVTQAKLNIKTFIFKIYKTDLT